VRFLTRKWRPTTLSVALLVWLFSAMPTRPKNEFIVAEGVVVAIQGGKTDTRVIEPSSFADLAEVYMVRVDRWSRPRNEAYILVEYIHHTGLIPHDASTKPAGTSRYTKHHQKRRETVSAGWLVKDHFILLLSVRRRSCLTHKGSRVS
jgi:hypothetical protein